MHKIYLITTQSVFTSWYAVQADEMPPYDVLVDHLRKRSIHELKQAWQGETIESIVELTEDTLLKFMKAQRE